MTTPDADRTASRPFSRPRGDAGAMAVFVSLLLVIVLLPATALGLTSYTRSAIQAEKVRAADSGALAGAAALVLVDVSEIPANPLSSLSTEGVAFTRATAACDTAAASDDALSEEYANPVSCVARYSPDTTFAACADSIFDLIPTPVPLTVTVPGTGITLPGLPGPLGGGPGSGGLPIDDGTLLERLLGSGLTLDLRSTTKALVPALLHNGITTTLTYQVRGPLDGLLGADGPDTATAVSTARRRFKPLLPPAIALGQLTLVSPEDLGVYTVLGTTLGILEEVLDEGITALPLPLPAVPAPLGDPAGLLPGGCRGALVEVVRDLRDALKPAGDEVDLLTCLGQKVLGLDALAPLRNLDDLCVAKLFRAQLAPRA